MANIELILIIIGASSAGIAALLGVGNFIYTSLKTKVKGPDFRVNKILELYTSPHYVEEVELCRITLWYYYWNYGDRPTYFFYEIKIKVISEKGTFTNTQSREIRLEPNNGDKIPEVFDLPKEAKDWTEGTVKFKCDFLDHNGNPKTYKRTFPVKRPVDTK